MSNSSIWTIGRTISGATTLGKSRPGSDSNEGVLHIPKSSSIIEASPSDFFASYLGYSLAGYSLVEYTDNISADNPSAKMLSVYSGPSEFELQSYYYVHFWTNTPGKGMKPVIFPGIVSLLIQEYLWHTIINEGWYAIAQRNQSKPTCKSPLRSLLIWKQVLNPTPIFFQI